jgi:phage terminase large subunit GpA-like protein
MSTKHEGSDPARIVAGLEILFDDLLGREWIREDGSELQIALLLVDANGKESEAIKIAAKRSIHRARIMTSFGKGITAGRRPISLWPERVETRSAGPEWTKTKREPGRKQSIMFDTNYWKTRFHNQLALPVGEPGALVLYKLTPKTQTAHNRSAEGYRAERPAEIRAVSTGRTVQEWALIPGRENHPLDCAVGCMVAASIAGVTTGRNTQDRPRKRKRKVSYA